MCLMICYFEEPECAEGAVCQFLPANVSSTNEANQEPSKTGVRTLIKTISQFAKLTSVRNAGLAALHRNRHRAAIRRN